MQSPKSNSELILPISRIKTIMKSSPGVEIVKQEPLIMIAHLTELFLADFAKRAYSECKDNSLRYHHLAEIVQTDDKLDFLRQIVPRKITIKEFKDHLARKSEGKKQSELDSEESEVDENDIKIVMENGL